MTKKWFNPKKKVKSKKSKHIVKITTKSGKYLIQYYEGTKKQAEIYAKQKYMYKGYKVLPLTKQDMKSKSLRRYIGEL